MELTITRIGTYDDGRPVNGDQYSSVDDNLIPKECTPVENSDFDFRRFHRIGERIQSKCPQICACRGYDVNYILSGEKPVAVAVGDQSGIRMEVETNRPDIQLFTGMGLGSPFLCRGKHGAVYEDYGGFCLEPQAVPDAVNGGHKDQVVLKAGTEGLWKMSLIFSVEREKEE